MGLARRVEQRVLAQLAVAQVQVDVRAGLECRQRRASRVAEFVEVDAGGRVLDAHQAQLWLHAQFHTAKHMPVPVPAGVR